MKNMIRIAASSLCLVAVAAYADIPAMNVTVSDGGGKAAFKGTTSAKGTFATPKLKPGNYTVQFNAKMAAPKGSRYAIVVSSGQKKVTANAVPGEKFSAGGVAVKVDVGDGLNITGQIAGEGGSGQVSKSGKKMVWIPPRTGSNFGGHWAEEGSAEAIEAKSSGTLSTQGIRDLQNRGASPGN